VIFTSQLGRLNYTDAPDALKKMADHIRYIQEQLEYTLMNLDSSNITEIETDVTDIKSSDGGAEFSGNSIKLSGKNGEVFEAGVIDNTFRFRLLGKNGAQLMYLTSDGNLVITRQPTIVIDGGEW